MKGFVWDYIVDLKLDVTPDSRFRPKEDLPRILTSDVFYDLRKPLEEANIDVTSKEAAKARRRHIIITGGQDNIQQVAGQMVPPVLATLYQLILLIL